jgi:hypothetical protein
VPEKSLLCSIWLIFISQVGKVLMSWFGYPSAGPGMKVIKMMNILFFGISRMAAWKFFMCNGKTGNSFPVRSQNQLIGY